MSPGWSYRLRPGKAIDLEGRIVKDGVRKAIKDRQIALTHSVILIIVVFSTMKKSADSSVRPVPQTFQAGHQTYCPAEDPHEILNFQALRASASEVTELIDAAKIAREHMTV
jgi:hypothetical protein